MAALGGGQPGRRQAHPGAFINGLQLHVGGFGADLALFELLQDAQALICGDPTRLVAQVIQEIEPQGGNDSDDAGGIPKPGRRQVIQNYAGQQRPHGCGDDPAKSIDGHVAPAHFFWRQAGDDGLAHRRDHHLAHGDHDHSQQEHGESGKYAIHGEANGIQERPGCHDDQRAVGRDPARDGELEQHHHAGVQAQDVAEAAFIHAVGIAQIDGEGGVHLHVYQHHEGGGDQVAYEGRILQCDAIAGEGLRHALRRPAGFLRFPGFVQGEKYDDRRQQAGDGVEDEQHEIRLGGDQAADERPDDDGQVEDDAQDAEALGALFFGQQVGDQGLLGRAAGIGQHAHDQHDGNKPFDLVYHAHQERRQGAHHQAEEQHALAPQAVGQRPAHQAAGDAGDGENPEDQAHLGHVDAEFLGQVEGEEGEEHRPAQAVDKGGSHHDPELAWEFVKGVFGLLEAVGRGEFWLAGHGGWENKEVIMGTV